MPAAMQATRSARVGVAGIALGVVDGEVGADDPAARDRGGRRGRRAARNRSRGCRANPLRASTFCIQHVEIHVQPGPVEPALLEPRDRAAARGFDAFLQHALRVDAGDLGPRRCRRSTPGTRPRAAPRSPIWIDVGVPRERTLEIRPRGQERFAAPAREREVHAGRGAQRLGRGVALVLGEITVAVHVHEPSPAREPRAIQAPEQHAAIPADHHRETPGLEDALHLLGQREREGADGVAVADAGARLGLDLVQRPFGRHRTSWASSASRRPASINTLRRLPGAGLLAVLRAQPEVGRREHEAHGARRAGAAVATLAPRRIALAIMPNSRRVMPMAVAILSSNL